MMELRSGPERATDPTPDGPIASHGPLHVLGLTHTDLVSAASMPPYRMSEYWLDRACQANAESRRQLWQRLARESATPRPPGSDREHVYRAIWSGLGLDPDGPLQREVAQRLAEGAGAPVASAPRELPPGPAASLHMWNAVAGVFATARAVDRARSWLDWDDRIRIAAVVEVVCRRMLLRPRVVPAGAHDLALALATGMLYGSIRLDHDLLVASGRYTAAAWIDVTVRRLGLLDDAWLRHLVDHPPPAGLALAALVASRHAARNPAEYLLDPTPLSADSLLAPVHDPLSLDERTDIPSQAPVIRVPIARVGTSRVEVPITYLDSNGRATVASCEIDVTIRLPADRRGVHMSRFQEAAMRLTEREWQDLGQATEALVDDARTAQATTEAEAQLQARVFFRKLTERTRRCTLIPARLEHVCRHAEGARVRAFHLTLGVMTACPCTLAYSKLKSARTLAAELGVPADVVHGVLPPTFTHSQPGALRVGVSGRGALPRVDDVFEAIASSAHLVESVLKRPDEHALVERTHEQPQFCEDIVRSVAVAVAALCGTDDEVRVRVELDESIHPHRAVAELRDLACHLWQGDRDRP